MVEKNLDTMVYRTSFGEAFATFKMKPIIRLCTSDPYIPKNYRQQNLDSEAVRLPFHWQGFHREQINRHQSEKDRPTE